MMRTSFLRLRSLGQLRHLMSMSVNGSSSLLSRNFSTSRTITNTGEQEPEQGADKTKIRLNPCNIQMISDELFEQIFIDCERETTFSKDLVDKCKRHLEKHDLWNRNVKLNEPVKFLLPELEGVDLDNHFKNIARQQTHRYKELLEKLLSTDLPKFPETWAYRAGWTQYLKDGSQRFVNFPEDNALVLDVEVCMKNGQVPTLACAASFESWYSWCSPHLIEGSYRDPGAKVTLDELIPLETDPGAIRPPSGSWTEKIIIGHNVSFDRTKIKEQFLLEKSNLRFMDTMSLHIAISGITSFQRALKMTMKSKAKQDEASRDSLRDVSKVFEWNDLSSLNNLADVYKLYCDGAELNKDDRNVFVKGTVKDIQDNFQNLALYCANDVKATYGVLKATLPQFYERFPHPVTLCGMLEMGTTYLPVNQNWDKYIQESDRVFQESEKEVKSILMKRAEDALSLMENEKYKEDPWLWDLDWKVTKRTSKKVSPDIKPLPAWYKKLLYKPTEEDYQPGPAKIGSSMKAVPKLLKLTWYGFPLHHSKTGGWGFLVKKLLPPNDEEEESSVQEFSDSESASSDEKSETGFPFSHWEPIFESSKDNFMKQFVKPKSKTRMQQAQNDLRNKSEDAAQDLADFIKGLEIVTGQTYGSKKKGASSPQISHSPHPKCEFIPLPHKNGINFRVGNPLGKDFLGKIEEGILTCQNDQDVADKVVKISKQTSYWRNNRDRVVGQMTVWQDEIMREKFGSDYSYGAIIPQVVVAGTLTRRAVEATWMTASNAYVDRVGSELKSMIQAPPNYHFVGADVDSQELWIASVIGDAHFAKQHGSTALGWMTLQGSKSEGTDMHSMTAKVSGIARDQAKILNYARIYGAGVTFADRLLLQFNPNMSAAEAKKKAKAMFKMTKGDRKYLLNKEGVELASHLEELQSRSNFPLSKFELQQIIAYHQFPYKEYMSLVDKLVWDSGTESDMFNRLEEIAQKENPRTPVLNCLISRSLVPSVVQNDYMTSRVNWVVQSSAVDYLHLMLTCMGWLIKKFSLKARFCISVHDEVRYLVESEDRYRVALALQITNLLTRSFCSYRMGMNDLPQSVGFFSCVDVDKVLRKEVTDDCNTPSNSEGLAKTYNIPKGEALDISETLKLTKGTLCR